MTPILSLRCWIIITYYKKYELKEVNNKISYFDFEFFFLQTKNHCLLNLMNRKDLLEFMMELDL